jgi:hypothetical protein
LRVLPGSLVCGSEARGRCMLRGPAWCEQRWKQPHHASTRRTITHPHTNHTSFFSHQDPFFCGHDNYDQLVKIAKV